MKCLNLSVCKRPIQIFIDNIYICKTCHSVYGKKSKHIFCCNKQNVNKKHNISYCNNCYTILTYFHNM